MSLALGAVTQYSGTTAPAASLAGCIAQAFAPYMSNGPGRLERTLQHHAVRGFCVLERQVNKLLLHSGGIAFAVPITCHGDEMGTAAVGSLLLRFT